MLISAGPVDAQNEQGETPLHLLAMKGNSESLRIFLAAAIHCGLDIDCTNK